MIPIKTSIYSHGNDSFLRMIYYLKLIVDLNPMTLQHEKNLFETINHIFKLMVKQAIKLHHMVIMPSLAIKKTTYL